MTDPDKPIPRSLFQRLILAFVSAQTARDMESQSRDWKLVCTTCDTVTTSIWDSGGIRYKPKGRPRTFTWMPCPVCGKRTMHRLADHA